jgi:hypothetical protein
MRTLTENGMSNKPLGMYHRVVWYISMLQYLPEDSHLPNRPRWTSRLTYLSLILYSITRRGNAIGIAIRYGLEVERSKFKSR